MRNINNMMLRDMDVVSQGTSKSRRIKNVDGYFIPRAVLMLTGEKGPQKEGLYLSKQTAMGLWSCQREQTVKGACTITQATRD